MELRRLTTTDEYEALQAHEELARENFDFLLGFEPGSNWEEFLQKTENLRQGIGLSRTQVPATFLAALDNGELVGRVSIRHKLNASLRAVGGHLGYAVRPRFRRRGYAGQILGLALKEARGLGISNALLTCDADNVASKRVIERYLHRIETTNGPGAMGKGKLRYWIRT